MAELMGQTFAGYEIVAKLGEGGMGAVYKAKQPILNRFVALKTMAAHLGGDKEFVARFQREAASAATLSHPNVVGVHTAGEVDGTRYIVMEFVEGESVRKRLDREGKIPPAEALAITIYVAQALQYAWNKAKLIHRDIKPDNIFLSSAGEVKVGDLGLAKSLATEGTEMTATGMAMGSPHYISPEQATGIRDIDYRTDIYSLGCTLYHMLTGQTPYKGDSSMIVMMKHVNDPPPAIFKAWPQCPMPLGMLVGRMLAKDRNARPKSYEQLNADLFAVSEKLAVVSSQSSAVSAQPAVVEKAAAPALAPATSPDAPTISIQPSAKPKKPVAIYAAAGVAALLALGGLFLWSPWKTEPGSESRLQAESAPTPPAKAGTPNVVASSDLALKQLGSVYKNAVGAEMLFIPPGEFMLGSTKEEREWAAKPENMNVTAPKAALKRLELEGQQPPRRAVICNGFWLGRTEVTVGQWRKFAEATGYRTSAETKGSAFACEAKRGTGQIQGAYWRDLMSGAPPRDDHAVTCISWEDAMTFCKWLTEAERKSGRLPSGYAMRLPGEAEWEYACRGGKAGTRFWWGDAKEDGEGRLHWCKPSTSRSSVPPVDSFGEHGRNGFGLADMLGNVWEWCLDHSDPAGAHVEVFTGSSPDRVLKGGCFESYPLAARCASRDGRPADTADFRYGFRVCCGVDVPGKAAGTGTVPTPAEWKNLIPLIDPKRDGIAGIWKVEDGKLYCTTRTPWSFCELPVDYRGGNYDLRFRVTRGNGRDVGIFFLFRKGITGGTVLFDYFNINDSRVAKGVKVAGLTNVKGEPAPRNETRRERPSWIPKGQEKTVLIQVRDEGMVVTLDGEEVFRWEGNWEDVTQQKHMLLSENKITRPVFGVSPHDCEAVFSAIEMQEVTGKDTFTRNAPAAASDAFLREVAALPAEQQVKRVVADLKKLNPEFDASSEKHVIEGNDVVELSFSALNVSDISPVRALKKLRSFTCIASTNGKKRSKLVDLTPLRGLPLERLRVPGTDVSDLSPVAGMPLNHLGIGHTRITDLSPLKGAPLDTLMAEGVPLRDLSPLRDMPLTTLWCDEAVSATPANQQVLKSISTLKTIKGSRR